MRKKMMLVIGCLMAMQAFGVVYAANENMPMGDKPQMAEKKPMDMDKMEKMKMKHLDKMTKDLTLSADQKDKVWAIMKADMSDPEMMKMSKKDMMAAEDTKIMAVLTPEQTEKYKKMQMEHKTAWEKKKKTMQPEEEKMNYPSGKKGRFSGA